MHPRRTRFDLHIRIEIQVFSLRWDQPMWRSVMYTHARKIVQGLVHKHLSLIDAARRELYARR